MRDLGPVQIHQAEQQGNEHAHGQNLLDLNLSFLFRATTYFSDHGESYLEGMHARPVGAFSLQQPRGKAHQSPKRL